MRNGGDPGEVLWFRIIPPTRHRLSERRRQFQRRRILLPFSLKNQLYIVLYLDSGISRKPVQSSGFLTDVQSDCTFQAVYKLLFGL
jgi:hypothetical protein